MRNAIKGLLAFAVIFMAVMVAYGLVVTSPRPDQVQPPATATTVRVMEVRKERLHLQVRSQGTVAPETESELIPEVSGRVLWISPKLVAGGYFEKDDVLLRIDDRDYRSNVARSRASVERARAEHSHARFELQRLRELSEKQLASQSALESAIRAERVARATLEDAEVALEQAQRDLWRTEIRAPWDGLVSTEHVDQGQFVTRGQSIASIYASDSVEIRLPVADRQLAWLDLPLGHRGELPEASQPDVTLSTNYAGKRYMWHGKLVRTEAGVDSRSRMVHAVARVRNDAGGEGPPLPIGLFVGAVIEGRWVEDVVSLPRAALRDRSRVLVVEDDRLHYRPVEVMRFEQDRVLIAGGLNDGEIVNVSPLQTVIDGMRVKPVRNRGET